MKKMKIACTYDSNFEQMCENMCSELMKCENLELLLNKLTNEGSGSHFRSKGWYHNLTRKMIFLAQCMEEIEDEEVICCSDADIQFFRPEELLSLRDKMDSYGLEYAGQKERDTNDFNGGFFLIRKNPRTMDMIRRINSEDLTKYPFAEQDILNQLLVSLQIKRQLLEEKKYLHGCILGIIGPSDAKSIVMHHATCAKNPTEKMKQMNDVRLMMGIAPIDWTVHKKVPLGNAVLNKSNEQKHKIVISRVDGNVDWAYTHNPEDCVIYNKGSDEIKGSIKLDNVGGCSHTYLRHIITNYDNICQVTIFTENNILGRGLRLERLFDTERLGYNFVLSKNPSDMPEESMLKNWWESATGEEYKEQKDNFFLGSVFSVEKELILRRSLESYMRIYQTLLDDPGMIKSGYCERSWLNIFKAC